VFVFAAFTKLNNIQAFAFAIKGFKVLDADKHRQLIISAAYTMPWVEMIAGVFLIIGLRTRAATATIGLMLIFFMAALIHVIMNDSIDADCSCFGDMNLVCDSAVGWCQVIRDLVLLLPVVYLLWRDGGLLSLDSVFKANKSLPAGNEPTYSSNPVDESDLRA
jgi:uncharacterized membrane protein YphA (DoxX/SURF4 family)